MNDAQTAAFTSALIRAELLKRGLTRHDLAKATGLDFRAVSNLIAGNHQTPRGRALIEAALDQAFWTDPAVFAQRRALRPFHGGDHSVVAALNLDSEAGKQFPVFDRARPRTDLLRRLGVTSQNPHSHETVPPQCGEDGGTSADLPPTVRADSADQPTSPDRQP